MAVVAASTRIGERHVMEAPPEAQLMSHMPLCPRMYFPPQPFMDTDPADGPISVAYQFQPQVFSIHSKFPCPNTGQYNDRFESFFLHPALKNTMPASNQANVCGYVQAAMNDEDGSSDLKTFNIAMNNLRLVYASIQAWCFYLWRDIDDFHRGMSGLRGTARPIAFWDLRTAVDCDVDFGDWASEVCPHRIRIITTRGNLFFRVEHPEDVPIWYKAIKKVMQEWAWQHTQTVDRDLHREKRWPAARGIAKALLNTSPIGSRAMAILYHCYDIDYNNVLMVGEVMVLIQEVMAGIMCEEGRAEGEDRSVAVQCALSRFEDQEDLYDRAQKFVRRCTDATTGKIKKDNFIRFGHAALCEALDLPTPVDFDAYQPPDACSVM